jgi:hypothetical protein
MAAATKAAADVGLVQPVRRRRKFIDENATPHPLARWFGALLVKKRSCSMNGGLRLENHFRNRLAISALPGRWNGSLEKWGSRMRRTAI